MESEEDIYKQGIESLARNYYGKILKGEINEAGATLKDLAKLHFNYYKIFEILKNGEE